MESSRQEYWSMMYSLLQGSSWPRDWTQISCIAGRFFAIWATRDTFTPKVFNSLNHVKILNTLGFVFFSIFWIQCTLSWSIDATICEKFVGVYLKTEENVQLPFIESLHVNNCWHFLSPIWLTLLSKNVGLIYHGLLWPYLLTCNDLVLTLSDKKS